jgi:lysophospholipase L1-like esterase
MKLTNRGSHEILVMDKISLSAVDRMTGVSRQGILVTKNGKKQIVLKPDEEVFSDEIEYPIQSTEDFSIVVYFKQRSIIETACLTWAAKTWHSSFWIGDAFEQEGLTAVNYLEKFPILNIGPLKSNAVFGFCKIMIYTNASIKTVALFGDSLTHMSFFSDPLTLMLYERYPGTVAVLNDGISGNRLLKAGPKGSLMPGHGKQFGGAGIKRFRKDVFEDTIPDVVFCMEGVNDCAHGLVFHEPDIPTGETLLNAASEIVKKAHETNTTVYFSTIPPFGCLNEPWREEAEQIRQSFNQLFRETNVADDWIDLDQIMRREDDIHKMKDSLHLGDGVHPNETGGKLIAESICNKWLQIKNE